MGHEGQGSHHPSSRYHNLLWFGQIPTSRDIRIRLTVVTEAGFGFEVGEILLNSAGFHFCLMDTSILEAILSDILHIRHLTQGLTGRKSSVMEEYSNWIIATAL